MNEILMEAIKWRTNGIAIFPLQKKEKIPAIKWKPFQTILPTPQQIINWFSDDRFNLAVVCGWDGLTVLDFDDFKWFEVWRVIYPWINTYMVKSGREGGGVHAYFFVKNVDVSDLCEKDAQGKNRTIVEVKGPGRYVVAPPSIHPITGRPYQVMNDAPIMQIENLSSVAGMLPKKETNSHQYQAPIQPAPPLHIEQKPLSLMDELDIPYVPERLSDVIKEKIKIIDILKQVPEPSGGGYSKVFCPLHPDGKKTGNRSMKIYPDGIHCKCFAGCNDGKLMTVIDLYMAMKGISNNQAIKELVKLL